MTDDTGTPRVPQIDPDESLLTAAMAYGKLGKFYLAPTAGHDIKNPGSLLGGRWQAKTVQAAADVFAIFGEDHAGAAGIALHAGRSGLIVIDLDDEDEDALPEALMQAIDELKPPYQTTRKNAVLRGHYLFRQPEGRMIGNGRGSLGPGKYDIRGKNGVIILPPSPHPHPDGEYRWQRTGEIPVLPDALARLLTDSTDGLEAVSDETIRAFLAAHVSELAPHALAAVLSSFEANVKTGKARHDSAVEAMCWAMREARAGLYPAKTAGRRIRDLFLAELERDPGSRRGSHGPEFKGITSWAIAQALDADEDRLAGIREKALASNDAYEYETEDTPSGQASEIPAEQGSGWTDAVLGGLLAEQMDGKFYWTAGLGWLKWDGTRWKVVSEEVTHERVRRWILRRHREAITDFLARSAEGKAEEGASVQDDPAVKGWGRAQSRGRIQAITATARGHARLLRDAAEFDTDPDLLNTPSGVVNLRTGQILPHDPVRLMTKITGAPYVPGAESTAFKSALESVPADALDWFQEYAGSAVTGHSGEQMLLLTGEGDNGKTLIMGSIYRALGDYAAKVPNTLLLKSKQTGGATPEKMTLRGIRLAYMEETPEESYLDANMVKELIEAEAIEGRHLYKDIVSWRPTHSLFLNTNHPPTLTDTGRGAWRRLTRLDFPYTYVPAGTPLNGDRERRAVPALKGRILAPEGLEAVLAWCVAGALRTAVRGGSLRELAEPGSVIASREAWRLASDDLLTFVTENMVLDLDGIVAFSEMFEAFSAWLKVRGQHPVSAKTFSQRLRSHSELGKKLLFRDNVSRFSLTSVNGSDEFDDGSRATTLPDRVVGIVGIRFKIITP